MAIGTISNGESGSGVRTKLNAAIAQLNGLGTASEEAATAFATAAHGAIADSLSALPRPPYRNQHPNGNIDPNRLGSYSGAIKTPPASSLMQEKNIKGVLNVGDSGANSWLYAEDIEWQDDIERYALRAAFAYSSTGTVWPAIRTAYYNGFASLGTVSLTDYIEIDGNNRLYYLISARPVYSSAITNIRFGCAKVTGAECEIGGFTYIETDTELSINDCSIEDWYVEGTKVEDLYNINRFVNAFSTKTIVFLGDSIVTDSYSIPEKVGVKLIANVINGAVGGSRLSGNTGYVVDVVEIAAAISSGDWTQPIADALARYTDGQPDNRETIATLAALDWSTVDIIVIAAGTNDYSGNADIGSSDSVDESTINGAINKIVQYVYSNEARRDIVIVFVTPIWRGPEATYGGDTGVNGDGLSLLQFQDAIFSRAEGNRVLACPLHKLIGINLYNHARFLNTDDLHPRPAGADRWAAAFSAWAKANIPV